MPDAAEFLLVDTSVAIPLVVADHEHHAVTAAAIGGRAVGLAGHAAFETYSVLTRLPSPMRRTPATVARLLSEAFPETRHLSVRGAQGLLGRLGAAAIAGGSTYDALVAAVAVEHDCLLATRDRRALDTYRAVDARVELLA